MVAFMQYRGWSSVSFLCYFLTTTLRHARRGGKIPRILNLCSRSMWLLSFMYLAVVIEKEYKAWLVPGLVKTPYYEKNLFHRESNSAFHGRPACSPPCAHNLQFLKFDIEGTKVSAFWRVLWRLVQWCVFAKFFRESIENRNVDVIIKGKFSSINLIVAPWIIVELLVLSANNCTYITFI